MALTPRLDLRQTQSLVMTPQLQQAIKLLQLSSLELSAYVETQIEQNPLLEHVDTGAESFDNVEGNLPEPTTTELGGDPQAVDRAVVDDLGKFNDAELDVENFDNVFDSERVGFESSGLEMTGATGMSAGRSGSFDDHDANLEEVLSSRVTLQEHLSSQLTVDIDDPVDRIIGIHLIDMVDEAGYLVGDIQQVAELLGCSLERVLETLTRLQHFDPAGVFARSLAECLSLQLLERGELDSEIQILLANLELLARRDWPGLCRVCGVDNERLSAMIALIRSLNPKPALAFDDGLAQPITPDVIMRPQSGGGWIIELNPETLPRVLVNNHYYTQVSRSLRNREDRQYINECLQTANWLVKSLHQRATTILKVASEIVRQQQGFFVQGIPGLRPLVLRDVAEAIGMHESTVSRVTSNKYVATPRGIYELKFFFTHAVGGSQGGDAHSAEAVRHRIKVLIDSEGEETILSDDAIAEVLQKEGIDIARRTVAKYREALRIPSSVQRRRLKGAAL